jgi:hypothetical protein
MQDNRKLIIQEFESLKGQFVIAGDWKVKRIVGVVEDDMDYYWLFYDGRKFSLDSCLCRIVALRGKIDDKDYDEFVRLAYLNHYDLIGYYCKEENKEEAIKYCEEHKKDLLENLLKEQENKNSLLTEICWDLNKIE